MMRFTYTLFHNQDALWTRPGFPDDTYIMGYSGKLYTDESRYSAILEKIFAIHNADDRPDGQMRPSLSVGDVVVLKPDDQAGEPYAHTVDMVGFIEWHWPSA